MVAGVHEQTDTPDLQDHELAGYSEALKCRGSLTIWFDPAMIWEGAPTGKRGRPRSYSDAAIQSCLTMKGEGRPRNDPEDRFGPERAEPRDGSAWRCGKQQGS